MVAKRFLLPGLMLTVFAAGNLLGSIGGGELVPQAEAGPAPAVQSAQVFELRTYTAAEGKLDDLLARFRDHTLRIFEKHGMTNVVYWTPQDEPLSGNTLIYVLAHASREAAQESWSNFRTDPEWQRAAEESRRDGRLVTNVDSVFLDPTDFSPMR
jgi:hypothetical protein